MIQEVYIKNYRSIAEARVKLSPFTLLIGANGTGKSNFLKLLEDIRSSEGVLMGEHYVSSFSKHFNLRQEPQELEISWNEKKLFTLRRNNALYTGKGVVSDLQSMQVFSINPDSIGQAEKIEARPKVHSDGSGCVRVLDALKTGDREDLFDAVEEKLKIYVPEIEKLSFIPGNNLKQLQVREKHIKRPVPVSELSEGTRLVLTILTILHQEKPPKIIGLEDIDRGLHPRLFRQIIDFCFQMTEEKGIQIIATTHNPYLLDHFKDDPEAVIIVEKKSGETTFTSLADRLEPFSDDEGPLGSLWYGGFVGGVPEKTY